MHEGRPPHHHSHSTEPTRISDTGSSPRESEDLDNAIAAQIEFHLLEAKKINEGNNGIIVFLPLSDEFIELLQRRGIVIREDEKTVAKVLKVYISGMAQREFETQKAAYERIEQSPNSAALAHVPRPLHCQTIPLHEPLQKILRQMNIKDVSKHVDVIIMEYLEGAVDIATLVYRALARHHGLGDPENDDFETLRKNILGKFGYTLASTRGRRDQALVTTEELEQRLWNENAERIAKELTAAGYALHPSILAQIKRTLDIFDHPDAHGNVIRYCDGHERNFMVRGNPWRRKPGSVTENTKEPDAFIIDFGKSDVYTGGSAHDDDYDEMGVRYRRPQEVLKYFAKMTKTADEQRNTQQEEQYRQFRSLIERARGRLPGSSSWKIAQKLCDRSIDSYLDYAFSEMTISGDTKRAEIVLVLEDRLKSGKNMQAEVDQALDRQCETADVELRRSFAACVKRYLHEH